MAVLAACSSSKPTAGPITVETAPPTIPTHRLQPDEASRLRVAVPFSADRGALVVTHGAAPAGFSASAAEHEFSTIMTSALGDPDARIPHQLLVGRVSLTSGLGTPPVFGERAWVVVYEPLPPSCAPGRPGTTQPALPPYASGLSALIFTQPGATNAITYQGAGTGECGVLNTRPSAWVGPLIS